MRHPQGSSNQCEEKKIELQVLAIYSDSFVGGSFKSRV